MIGDKRTLLSVLRERVESTPDTPAFTFSGDDGVDSVSFSRLYREALRVCGELQAATKKGDRALLVYAPSVDYIVAFYGCLMAGVVAVPVYPPTGSRFESAIAKIAAIGRDCDPAVVLTVQEIADVKDDLAHLVGQLATVRWIATDTDNGEGNSAASISDDDIALLQYSSGSTGSPKGVVLRHHNLAHNLDVIGDKFALRPEDSAVIWLPPYHDMGLIGGVLAPIWHGLTVHLMSPFDFLRDPGSWLRKIDETRATASGGPNFAYDLCSQRMTDEECAELDLSSWRIAFSGAEPIRASTLDAFAERFAPQGFDARAWYPCYGLAEATLLVAGGRPGQGAAVTRFDRQDLEVGRARPSSGGTPLVSCGTSHPDQDVRIVAPGTTRDVGAGRVGEIIVSGVSADTDYWCDRGDAGPAWSTRDGRRYLRTGDLGFVHSSELYVTGRLKDVIIRAGRNYYPQDLEASAETVDLVRPGASVAIETVIDGAVQVTLVVELVEADTSDQRQRAVAAAITEQCVRDVGLGIERVVLLPKGSVLRTSSGKVRRQPTAAALQNNEIDATYDTAVARPTSTAERGGRSSQEAGRADAPAPSAVLNHALVHAQVVTAFAEVGINLPPEGGQVHMDSLQALGLAHRVGLAYPPGPDVAVLLAGCRVEEITSSTVEEHQRRAAETMALPELTSAHTWEQAEAPGGRTSIPCTPNQVALIHSILVGDDPAIGVLA
ncbi:MAG: fatty acyl-AMP ligase, partial [Actinomycetota bacterium]|nr:fatty acyl-AMP ligase [Actinomycetota bacterium]